MADTSFITASSSSGTYATASSSSGLLPSSLPISPISTTAGAQPSASASVHLQAPPSDLGPAGASASAPANSSPHTQTQTDDCAHEVAEVIQSDCGCNCHSRSGSDRDIGGTRLMRENSASSSTPSTRPRTTGQNDLAPRQVGISPSPQQQRTVSANSVLLSPIANIENHTEQARKRLAALDTRSMGVIRRPSRGPGGVQQRERAYSDSRPTPALVSAPAVQPIAPTKETKKGGFSAFLRRLTKRKPAKLASKDVNIPINPPIQEVPQSSMSKVQSRNTGETAVIPPSVVGANTAPSTHSASMSSRHTAASVETVQHLSLAQSIASAHRLATTTSNSSQLGVPLKDVDPVNVPLPPSPNMPEDPSGTHNAEPIQSSPTTDGLPNSSAAHLVSHRIGLPRSRSASPRAYTQAIPIPDHGAARSLSQQQVQTQLGEDESIETIDEVRPLDSLRIITRARSMSPGQPGPLSAGGSSIAETVLQTPVTVASSPPLTIPSLASAMRSSVLESASDGEIGSIPEETLDEQRASETSTRAMNAMSGETGQNLLTVSNELEFSQERESEKKRDSSSSSHGEMEMREEMQDETMEEVDYLDTPMYAGSSPPRKAPIGSAPPVALGRKESKWRRSVMGLSDIRNGSLGRKASSRAPPTPVLVHVQGQEEGNDAFDSLPTRQARTLTRSGTQSYQYQQPQQYQQYQHQQRRQNHRVSCQPTLHSNASIAAQVRGIKDDKEKEAAETMFMM